jgi:hypothetical protein
MTRFVSPHMTALHYVIYLYNVFIFLFEAIIWAAAAAAAMAATFVESLLTSLF